MITIYRERSNGRWEYFTYSDALRVFINSDWAHAECARGRATLVTLEG